MVPVHLGEHPIRKLALAQLIFVYCSCNVAKLQEELDHAEKIYKLLTVCTEPFKRCTNRVL